MADDRTKRLAELRAQRDAIDAQITALLRLMVEDFADAAGLTADERARLLAPDAIRERARSIALQAITKPAKVMSDMVESHRVALSVSAVKRLKRGRSVPDAAFMAAIQAKGYTQATLAAAVGIKQPTLSAHRKAKDDPNSRPIPTARAERIQQLTGWPADARHWPCGLSD